jgi:hypothetical protein
VCLSSNLRSPSLPGLLQMQSIATSSHQYSVSFFDADDDFGVSVGFGAGTRINIIG